MRRRSVNLSSKGKTVIVTGAGSNIGRGIFLGFAKEGANVVNAEIDEKQAKKVVAEAAALGAGGKSIFIKTDVTDRDSVQAMVKKTIDEFGRIDVLVNNAGTALYGSFFKKRIEDLEYEMKICYWSQIYCIKAVVQNMIDGKQGGCIINIGSDVALVGGYQFVGYSAAKGAVCAMTRSLAMELGPFGIRVNCVSPSLTVPESIEHVGDGSGWKVSLTGDYGPERQEIERKKVPLGRLGYPYDIANVCVFLASDYASYVHGQVISVNGGRVML
ncbi:MAG: hypothetical protein A2Y60_06080 [Chloroflexi bacterium RBG_13_54_9]|nr:MAG: hypothetical protein A2Y60_06080 [Chloroflexi bacterium RBG_13_54_9]